MRLPRYANRKTELAQLIGISLTKLYQLQRLPGFPRPRSDGRWNVREVERFALNSAKKLVGPNERDRLQAELLTLKVQRATQELTEYSQKLRAEIRSELIPMFDVGPALLKAGLGRLRNECCPAFEGMNAREIWRVWRDGERRIFNEVYAALRKRFNIPLVEPTENIPMNGKVKFDDQQKAAI